MNNLLKVIGGQAGEKAAVLARKILICLLILTSTCFKTSAQVTLTATSGIPAGSFTTLKQAFDAINSGIHQGDIIIYITANTNEGSTPATLNSGNADPASYTSILIQPSNPNITVTGNPAAGFGVIQLNGADNVTINGDNPNAPGQNRDLTINNTSAAAQTGNSVIRVATSSAVTSADNISILNCILNGNVTSGNASGITTNSTSTNISFGIYVGGNAGATVTGAPTAIVSDVANAAPAGTTINSFLAQNNEINQCGRAIVFNGGNSSVCNNVDINGNTIGTNAVLGAYPYTTPATTVYVTGIWVAGANAVSITANTINNVISYVGILTTGINLAANIGSGTISIADNIISGVANNGTSPLSITSGIDISSGGTFTISGNDISTINNQSGFPNVPASGIRINNNSRPGTIESNRITAVLNKGASPAEGINIYNAASGMLIRNNFISNVLNGGNNTFGVTGNANGILLNSGSSHKVYHNSVNMTGVNSSTSTNSINCIAVASSAQTGIDIRNNIFSNTVGGGSLSNAYSCVFLPFAVSAGMNLTINNNAYFTGTTAGKHAIAFAGTTAYNAANLYTVANFNPYTTLGATNWRSIAPGWGVVTNDLYSFASTAAAPFTSATDLHIPAATNTPIESGGADLSTALDIDAAVRNLNFPDIGADEFSGAINDIVPPVINYTALSNTCDIGNRQLIVTITDPSGVPVSGTGLPVLYWQINGGGYNPATGVSIGSGQYQFNFGAGAVLGDVVTYYVVAQDNNANVIASPAAGATGYTSDPPDASTATTTPRSYSIQGTLTAGTYDVGVGQTYTTITAAITDYNNSCPDGNIIFRLMDANYPSETYPIVIDNPNADATHTLTILPAAGVAANISGSNATALFKLNDIDYVTFDGLNTGGSSLTITNTNAGTSSVVFWLAGSVDGAQHNTIRNCTIKGSGSSATFAGIACGGSGAASAVATAPNSNTTITGCDFAASQYGVYVYGDDITADQALQINNNTFGSTVTASDKMGLKAIYIHGVNNYSISGNIIHGVSSASAVVAAGIAITGNSSNGTISKNKISDIKQTSTSGSSSGIYLASMLNGSATTVTNNFIWDVGANGSSTLANNGSGIYIAYGGGYSVYYNSVDMLTNATAANSISAAMVIAGTVTFPNGLNIRNNIFSNTTTVGSRYSIYSAATAAVFSNIDYNDYYSSTSTVLGYLSGNKANLGEWQAATGKDNKSLSINPLFVSSSDLHLQTTSPLNAQATAIASVTTDIDGDSRVAPTDIGADEFDAVNCSGAPVGGTIASTATTFCSSGSAYLSATGFTCGDGVSYQWQSSTDGFVTPVNLAGQTVPSNASTGNIITTTSYRLKVTCANGGGIAYSNVITITVNAPLVSTTTGATRCGRGTVNLTASTATGGASLNWYSAATGGSILFTGSPFTTPAISATTTYYVGASLGSSTGTAGPASPTAQGGTIGTQSVNWEVYFDVLQSATLNSIDIFPVNSGVTGSLTVKNSSGTTLITVPYTTNVSGGATPQTITINLAMTAGTNYYITGVLPTGGLSRNESGAAYPYNSSAISITGNGFSSAYYLGYYNFRFTGLCESPRIPVTATVTTPPAISATATPSIICVGGTSILNVTSGNSGYTYLWTPGSLAGATVGANPVVNSTYTVTATDASGGPNNGCVNRATVNVIVRPLPSAVSVSPSIAAVCLGGLATQLTATGGVLSNVSALSENFNSSPTTWTTINNSTGGIPANAAWTQRPNAYIYKTNTFNSNDASQFFLSNSNAQGSGSMTSTILQSPAFTLSGFTTANLSFYHHLNYQGGETAIVEVSTDAITWLPVAGGNYTSSVGASNGFVAANLNLDAYAGQATVYIRFRYDDAIWKGWWAIDNVSITGNMNTSITWTQAPAAPASIFTDAGASIPYTAGTDLNTVYVQPTVNTVYTATATGPAPPGCSSSATSTVSVTPPVSVTIVASDNPVCPSATVIFTATVINGGPSPSYQWQVNGANVGTNSSTYSYIPSNGDIVTVIVNGNGACTYGNPATSNAITMSVAGAIAVAVNITANPGSEVCEGTLVTFTATPVNGGPSPTYQWKKNGVNVGTNSPTYSYAFAYAENGDAITCTITSNSSCISGVATATSPQILMTIHDIGPVTAVIGTTLGINTVCAGTVVTVRATPYRQGNNPTYEFFVNNISQGVQASNDFVFTPVNGDKVKVKLTSNYQCLTGANNVTSNTITMTVLANVPASVSLSNSATLCAGQPITFTATPTNGGPSPTYDFWLNGSSVQNGASNTYILASPANGNTVQVIMTSSYGCVTSNPASSSIITLSLNASPVASAAANCSNLLPGSGQQTILTATATAGSGTISGYQWNLGGSPVVGATSSTYTTGTAGSYTVSVTNSNGCITTSAPPIVITNTGAALAAGTYPIPGTSCGTFDKVSSAVNYINTWGVAGAVIFDIAPGYTETAPAGGYAITATGTAANTITFRRAGAGNNPVITAGLQTAGSNNDAIFKIIGGDYITIRNLTLKENSGNTVTATGATNTMTEWGVAMLYATTTNGPSNNTIEADSISLNKNYPNSFGIYSNLRHSAAAVGTNADITNTSGGSNKIYSNAISNVNNPIVLVGAGAAMTPSNDIGGSSSATANSISDWGSNTANSGASAFYGVVPAITGIYTANQVSLNISWNSIGNATAVNAGAAGFRGIYSDFVGTAPSGTFTNTISNNSIQLNSSSTGAGDAFEGIRQGNTVGSAAVAGITNNITNNSIGMILAGAASATTTTVISNAFPSGILNISNNIIKGNTSTATTGGFTGIVNSAAVATTITISNNQFGDVSTDAISFSAANSGTVSGISNTGAGAAAVLSVNNNSFTRFVHTVTGTADHTYILNSATPATQNINNNIFTAINTNSNGALNCISSSTVAANKTISGNSFTSVTGGSGSMVMINAAGGSASCSITNNNIGNHVASSVSGAGSITGINLTNAVGGTASVTSNLITGISSSGNAAAVYGINSAVPSVTITGDSINTIAASGNAAVLNAVTVSGNATATVSQNHIHAINGTGTGAVRANGISITAGTTVTVFKNKIYDLTEQNSAGVAATLVNGIVLQGGTTVTAHNNFVSDLKAPAANVAEGIRAIAVTSTAAGSTYNVYYNSVYLNATSSGTDFGTTGLFHAASATATTAALNIRNNIFDNESVANGTGITAAFRRDQVTLGNYAATSNTNLFYAGSLATPGVLYYDGTNNDAAIASLQTRLSPREALSITAIPAFVSTTDLHLVATDNCGIDGAGLPIAGITDDIDADTRDASTPDIGADEFSGSGGGAGNWKGVNSNWLDPQNWCGQVPTASMNVVIGAGKPFYPVITTTVPVAKNVSIAAGGSITITGAGKLGIYGSISNSGIFNVVDGTIEMVGSGNQAIPAGAFQNDDIKNLIISNTSASPGVSLLGPLNLYGKLSFTGNNKTFTTGGNLTLKSTATGTASVGDITSNNIANSNNQITGNVTVERFVSAKRAWRFLSVPTQHNLQTIHESWQENQPANVTNPPGYGIQITKDSANWNTTGFDLQTIAGPSLKTYDPIGGIWRAVTSTIDVPGVSNGRFVPGTAYMTFVRGDRTVNSFPAAATTTVLREKGALITGDFSVPAIGAGQFAAIGNPYASAVDFSKLTKTNLQDVYYMWDPYLGSLGGYVTFAGPSYSPTPLSPSYAGGNFYIESGQAFFVKSSGAAAALTFKEPAKVDGSNLVARQTIAGAQLRTNFYAKQNGVYSLYDGVVSQFDPSYADVVDEQDAVKLANFGENLSIYKSAKQLSVERSKQPGNNDTIFYRLSQVRLAEYRIEFVAENMDPSLTGYLEDNYLHSSTPVPMSGTTAVDFTITTDAGSYAPDRFRLVFRQGGPLPVTFTSVKATKQRSGGILVEWNVDNEQNIDHYEVERSADGRNYSKLHAEAARGNGSGASILYKWLDLNPNDGDNFYRIRSISLDRDEKLSQVVKVSAGKIPAMISVYPNPLGPDRIMNINMQNKAAGNYKIVLLNASGQVCQASGLNHTGGSAVYSLLLSGTLAKGNYTLEVISEKNDIDKVRIVY